MVHGKDSKNASTKQKEINMSIIIKGMEMPDSCFHCKLAEVCQHYKAEHYATKRHEFCPLEEVPTQEERSNTLDALDCVRRQDVLDVIDKLSDGKPIAPEDVAIAVTYLPSAQSEQSEIIRCKDCKYSDTDNTLGVMFCWRVSYHEASEDGFCSWAERREDEGD